MSYENNLETIARLDAWLQKPDYVEGLRLYQELLGETVIYKVLLKGPNSFNTKKLTDTLKAEQAKLKEINVDQIITEPTGVADLRRNASTLMNERTALKAQIRMLTNEAQRKTRALRVLDICDELDQIYGQIEFFEINNTMWQPPTETESDDSVVRQYLNLRTYISKTAKALEETILPDKKKSLKQKLDKYQAQKAQLELTEAVKKYNRYAI
jgi:hypothetical protein